MQNVSFDSIEEFLEYLPEDERNVTNSLRQLVYDCIPEVKEKLSYQVPFFSRHKTLCFIWPGSVLWGKKRAYEGVRLGFTHGKLLSDEERDLRLDQRKHVAYMEFKSVNEIPFDKMRQWLFESVVLDDEAHFHKKTKK